MTTELRFKTNTLLKNLVGKDLINDDGIAVVELVKNAFDAQSPWVIVHFDDSRPKRRILLVDAGSGMDLDDIRDKWLNIAYSEKKNAVLPSGATYAGNKGVGRFSCDRLGARLDLVTRKSGGKILHLPVSWHHFEVEGDKDRLIQDVPMFVSPISEKKAEELVGRAFPAHGTALVISDLRSDWDRERLLELKRLLEKFLHPNQLFQRAQFSISLLAPSEKKQDHGKAYQDKVNGEVKNQVFEKLKFKSTYIEAVLDDEGVLKSELFHDGSKVFEIVERHQSYAGLGQVAIVIYYLNTYKKAYFARQSGVRAVDFGSIFLFLNGFRVSPYGDRGDDWLGLDIRKAQGTLRYLGSRDLVGRIEIRGPEDSYAPVSSREGLKNTPQFRAVRRNLFLSVLRRLERFVVDGLNWDSVPPALRDALRASEGLDWRSTAESYSESWDKKKRRIALSIIDLVGGDADEFERLWFNPSLLDDLTKERSAELTKLLSDIDGLQPGKLDKGLKVELSKIKRLLDEGKERLAEAKRESAELRVEVAEQKSQIKKISGERETYRAQTLFLQSVASRDVKELLAFHHQIDHDSTILGNYVATAMRDLRSLGQPAAAALAALQKAVLVNQRIAAVARFATKANFRAGMKKEATDIPAFVEQYVQNVARDFSASGLVLSVQNEVREAFEIKASRIELSIFIDNIISNATKALARSLAVHIRLSGQNKLAISFSDDGKGLSEDLPDLESMFEPGMTTTRGSGLGLYHARRIAQELGGTLVATTRSPNGMELRFEVLR